MFAGVVAGLALVGYAARLPILVRIFPPLQGMSPLTAFGLASLAAAIAASSWKRDRLASIAATAAIVVALATLACHAVIGTDKLSQMIGAALFNLPAGQIGRTSVATGTSLLLLALAVLFRRRRLHAADIASGASLVISATALLGYGYGVTQFYALPMFNTMALNTAIAIACLAVAELLVEPESGWASVVGSPEIGGSTTRRQLGFIALPIATGWLLLRAAGAAEIGTEAAMALLVIVTIVPLAILILRDGGVRNALDHTRRDKDDIQTRLTSEMEQKLIAQAVELRREAADRIKAEAAMYRAQRMETVGQLTGGIAHDFNNLLTVIRSNLELMQLKLPADEKWFHQHLESSMTATDKGAKVTARLLAFSRSQKLQLRPVEIESVLRSSRELIGSSLGPSINISLEPGPAAMWAMTDPDQLELAILNLAVNARDAMPRGGKLRIYSRLCHARLNDAADAAYVSICVMDNGTGMSEDVAARAIEPFFTTKERDKGTGLGLAQVYGFVRQCGGDLRIISAPASGTAVEILLPHTAPPAEREATIPEWKMAFNPAISMRRQVLVVDDDDAVRAITVDVLYAAGFEVLEAADGTTALSLLDSANPVAAVIDFLMPGMNGAELALLARKLRPQLPIVFVSGYSDTVALDAIADAIVLRKPFDMRALDAALNAVLS